jgi:hypothetical protein
VKPRKEEKQGVGTCSKGEETCFATLNSVSYQTHSPPGDRFIMSGFEKNP